MALAIAALPEVSIRGDRAALTRMLTNIVENALTYGAGRGTQVRLSGGLRHRGAVAGVWLQVADDGPGIAAEHLPHVCDRFYRIDPARTHSAGPSGEGASTGAHPRGHGLGLAISQRIIGDHGGALHLHSDGAHGVVVDIWLPAREMREE